jgi:hypothetical protein
MQQGRKRSRPSEKRRKRNRRRREQGEKRGRRRRRRRGKERTSTAATGRLSTIQGEARDGEALFLNNLADTRGREICCGNNIADVILHAHTCYVVQYDVRAACAGGTC